MSYSGTVHCGYCGSKGHNRLGCPDRRKQALAEPDSYIGRTYAREQENRKRQIASRACSYCSEQGHNRRGCKVLKEDKLLIGNRQDEYRREFLHATNSAGLGVGSLLRVPKGTSRDEAGPWSKSQVEMVTKINWDNIDFLLKDTDMSRDWRGRDRKILTTRVVGSDGFSEDANGWYSPPRHNDVSNITAIQLVKILPDAFNERMVEDEDNPNAQLIGPVSVLSKLPDLSFSITSTLDDRFNLDPGSPAKDYEKNRISLAEAAWSVVRKSEHEKMDNVDSRW